jgi:Zn-dependent protease
MSFFLYFAYWSPLAAINATLLITVLLPFWGLNMMLLMQDDE